MLAFVFRQAAQGDGGTGALSGLGFPGGGRVELLCTGGFPLKGRDKGLPGGGGRIGAGGGRVCRSVRHLCQDGGVLALLGAVKRKAWAMTYRSAASMARAADAYQR